MIKLMEVLLINLFEIQYNYLDHPKIIKEINNILFYLTLRNPKLA